MHCCPLARRFAHENANIKDLLANLDAALIGYLR
jgi:hypothetical protein